jgi:hypothetical protein
VIDLLSETPIPLAAACRLIPPARRGRRTHLSTLLRWIMHGVKAPSGQVVRLEAIRLGNRWHTSRAAIQRFADALTPQPADSRTPAQRTSGQRQRAAERAAAKLASIGM